MQKLLKNPYWQLPGIQAAIEADLSDSVVAEINKFGKEKVEISPYLILGINENATLNQINTAKSNLEQLFKTGRIDSSAWQIVKQAWQKTQLDPYLLLPSVQKAIKANPALKKTIENRSKTNLLEIAEQQPRLILDLTNEKLAAWMPDETKKLVAQLKELGPKRKQRAIDVQDEKIPKDELSQLDAEIKEIKNKIKSFENIINTHYASVYSEMLDKYGSNEPLFNQINQILQAARAQIYRQYGIQLPLRSRNN